MECTLEWLDGDMIKWPDIRQSTSGHKSAISNLLIEIVMLGLG